MEHEAIINSAACALCGSAEHLKLKDTIRERPGRETDFKIPAAEYYREICQCSRCGVYNGLHHFDFADLYRGDYNSSTYANKIADTYDRIMGFPFAKSDNKNRVKRVADFMASQNRPLEGAKVLDIGSGLCVFLGEFMKYGIEAHCLDPDPLSVQHAIDHVGVKSGTVGTFEDFETTALFDLITFNKVLEHVTDPIGLLDKASQFLAKDGLIYVELPEGDHSSAAEGFFSREEFFIEHFTVFNKQSMEYLVENAGYTVLSVLDIHEPSDKYSVYAFIARQ